MKIAIVGYGKQGASSYLYWREGNDITLCDQSDIANCPTDVALKCGPDYLSDLNQYDLIVRSPKIHPRDLVAANSPKILTKVTTNTNEFMRVCPSKNIIGVTGTKGKGTTSTLITKMLEATGKRVHLGGNIGIPPLDLLKNHIKPDDYVVLELANFQLIDLKYSPHIAVCLMVTPEHLDWHYDMAEYLDAKKQLFSHQTSDDIAIYYSENEYSIEVSGVSPGQKIPYFQAPGAVVEAEEIKIGDITICKTTELLLPGRHNWQNICAALTTVWQITKESDTLRHCLTHFKPLPFRIELIRQMDGVSYYNDSFASAPDATTAAINAINKPKVVIVGGQDRMLPLEQFSKDIKVNSNNIRKLLLIGASAERVAESLKKVDYDNVLISRSKTMNEIIAEAQALAEPGDAIILSPGFPSFDMFHDFEERGNLFNEAVAAL